MNFTIERVVTNGLSLVRLTDQSTGTYASILPSAGGLIHEFVIRTDNDDELNLIDNYKDQAELDGYLKLSYKGCKMSPFACRIAGGKWTYQGRPLEFQNKFKDGSAIHGLLFNKTFNISDEFADDNLASLTLRYHYKREDAAYPFDYVCETRYSLQTGNVLNLETTITNLDDEIIPLTDGWHPYFTLGGKVDDYVLQFASAAMLEFDEKLVPTGEVLEEPSFQVLHRLGEREIDNCYVLSTEPGLPCCVILNPLNKVTLSIFASDAYPYLQVFTPKHRQSIAIENLSGAPDNFNNGIGLIHLEPRRSITFNAWYRAEISS